MYDVAVSRWVSSSGGLPPDEKNRYNSANVRVACPRGASRVSMAAAIMHTPSTALRTVPAAKACHGLL
jgi:hypothetical protein